MQCTYVDLSGEPEEDLVEPREDEEAALMLAKCEMEAAAAAVSLEAEEHARKFKEERSRSATGH